MSQICPFVRVTVSHSVPGTTGASPPTCHVFLNFHLLHTKKPATPTPARRETGDAKPFQPRGDDVAQLPCYRARIDFARQHASRHRSNALAARCRARPRTRCGTSSLVLLNYSSTSRRGRRSFIVSVTYTRRSLGSWSRNRTCDPPIISRLLFPLSYPLALKTHLRSVHTVRSRLRAKPECAGQALRTWAAERLSGHFNSWIDVCLTTPIANRF